MEHGAAIPYFRELVVFLVAAGIVVPVFRRLHVSPVLGFLLIGIVIGPFGVARLSEQVPSLAYVTIGNIDGVRVLAELGVIFLLFMIGLELSFSRLWQMRRRVFGLGLAQVLITGAIIGGIASAFGNPVTASILLGACFALSSTAIVTQLMIEKRRLAAPAGRLSLSILLMQDLAVVPILFLVGALGQYEADGNAGELLLRLASTLAIAAAAVAAIIVIGRRVLAPIFRLIRVAESPELFMALTLLVVLGMAAATGAAGLSMALGAFLAGLLLAESEYRHAVEVTIEPFKGLLLGLFFISVGMGIDLAVALEKSVWLLASVAGLFAIKALVTFALALLFREEKPVALETAILLSQGGEFAFVVVGLSERSGVMEGAVAQFMLLVTSLSMLATPLMAKLAERVAQRSDRRNAADRHGVATAVPQEGHVLIVGFGRVGQIVAGLLDTEQVPWRALDFDSNTVAEHRRRGRPVHFGDGSRSEFMERLGAQKAAALIVTMDDPSAVAKLVAAAHRAWPKLPIYARARDARHADGLRKTGATNVVTEAFEASLQLGGLALGAAGLPDDAVLERLDRLRGNGPAAEAFPNGSTG